MRQDDKLTPLVFDAALDQLAGCDPDLGAVITAHGPPPMWSREPGFATLIHIILEQQVSLAASFGLHSERRDQLDGLGNPGREGSAHVWQVLMLKDALRR